MIEDSWAAETIRFKCLVITKRAIFLIERHKEYVSDVTINLNCALKDHFIETELSKFTPLDVADITAELWLLLGRKISPRFRYLKIYSQILCKFSIMIQCDIYSMATYMERTAKIGRFYASLFLLSSLKITLINSGRYLVCFMILPSNILYDFLVWDF